MKRRKKKIIILTTGIIIGILLLALIGVYLGRNSLLRMIVDKKTLATEKEYGLSIKYRSLKMEGMNNIRMEGLSIVPIRRDTLLNMQSMGVRFSLWALLEGDVEVLNVRIDKLSIYFTKKDSIANYDFLFRKKTNENTTENKQSN